MALAIQITSIIGLLLSIYAYYVEIKTKQNSKYKAVCDITEGASCGKVVTSEYGKIVDGISNSVGGIGFYILVLRLTFYNLPVLITSLQAIFYLSVLSVLGSIYLAYLQYFKIKSLCVVCTAIYIVNILLVVFSYLRL
jgi:vitamin-K-epoxide reductase (warfarin-sensitive)